MSRTAETESWVDYARGGVERARALDNRGPMRFNDKERLEQDILNAYNRCGFYVFTDVVGSEEVRELRDEFDAILDNAPTSKGSDVDQYGRTVKFRGYYSFASEDLGRKSGIEPSGEPEPAVIGLVSHPLMMMDSALRVYAHPDILRMVASIHGDDFIPFHESVFHKGAGDGPPTPWHQDGRTHWDELGNSLEQSDGSGKRHGFNLSVSWSRCTTENSVWVVPGSHRKWRLAGGGSFPSSEERIPEAVPVLMNPGDCALINRSALHGSYSNRSLERRVTMVLGYHNRASAIGASTINVHAFRLPGKEKKVTYSREYIEKRARMIPLAIDARRQRFPDEEPYVYRGAFIGGSEWNDQARAEISKKGDEYWQRDITL